MTRGIIGCVILALLLAAGLGVQWAVEALPAQAAAREDWDTALLHQETAQRGWRKAWRLTAAFADHQPMEDVDSLFARLPAYGEDAVEFSACCRELARRVRAVYEAHSLTWWNLL